MKKAIITTFVSLMVLAHPAAARQDSAFIKVSEDLEPVQQGKFKPTWESLMQYQTPEWFRNAKFGIWAHWGPQCVEATDGWQARDMYIEGSRAYNYHVKKYGHPSVVGFKDVLPHFKAERWNPDKLMAFYKKIGAQYFVALANHHDNFDMWNSKYQPWNSNNIGPKRDVLAEWAAAAHKYGLPFGISVHAAHASLFFETAQRYDRNGKYFGVPYDGTLTKADGKGKWWEGLDPQDLYVQDHPLSKGSWADGMISRQWEWGNGAAMPSVRFVNNVYNRTLDAINHYNPDLLYFDDTVLPFYPVSDAGLKIAAHFYNHSMATHHGKLEGVLNGKVLNEQQRKAMVWDLERGAPNEILPQPWQTCSCLGEWHYNTYVYEHNGYKSAATVVKLLADIVSKNGNLLLSVPLRGDGTFDEKEEAILIEFGDWMNVNKESIVGTRPFAVFGEGPVADADIKINTQGFNENSFEKLSDKDKRFTQTNRYLYVITMGMPADRTIKVGTLRKGNKYGINNVHRVTLLGYGTLKAYQSSDSLVVKLPSDYQGSLAPVIRIRH